ncbi:MAG: hypothetical protein O3C63_09610 [Cyanobacteria bacterium]|nr:hypothetical protein [Cyanobacteriota bacterium]MDA1019970.1 hypothetical protein [Cyanobacteriota bacterium]
MIEDIKIEFEHKAQDFIIDEDAIEQSLKSMELNHDKELKQAAQAFETYNPLFNAYRALN